MRREQVLFVCVVVASWALLGLPGGQPSLAQSSDGDRLKALEERLAAVEARNRELEAKNRELEERLGQLEKVDARFKPAAKVERPIEQQAENNELPPLNVKTKNRLTFYGFIRLDGIFADSRLDHSQFPFRVLSEDERGNPPGVRKDASDITFSPRLSRLGTDYVSSGGRLSGKFEIDWQNRGGVFRESRPMPRVRHAYLRYSWKNFALLAGQTWDIISPLFPSANNDSLMWNAGNLGDRRPQVRLSYFTNPKRKHQFTFDFGLGLQGAVDDIDDDPLGAELSGRPQIQARFGYSAPSWVKRRNLNFGLWLLDSRERVDRPIGGQTGFTSQAVGLDFALPLAKAVTLSGELFMGKNLADVRGGIAQGVNPATGEEIESKGGWLEILLEPTPRHRLAFGYTLDDPDNSDLPLTETPATTGRKKNSAFYLAHRFKVSRDFTLGFDFIHWVTTYRGFRDGRANRYNLVWQYDY